MRTEACTTRFDDLLQKLGLTKAAEKDQNPGFSVVWFGIRFWTKSGTYGMPAEKWMNLRLYVESKLMSTAGEVVATVDASSLLTVLGKFHHATLTWPAGRPCLYALWRLYFTATFRNNNPSKLRPKSQTLEVTEDARASILVWVQALTTRPPPIRRMLICSKAVPSITLDILRVKECPRTDNRIWLRLETPSCLWTRPEKLLDK